MAMKIRLSRGGSKKRPFYSIVAADSRMPRDGRFIEKLGTYNPLLPKDSEDRVKMNVERIQHWMDHGAQPSDRIGFTHMIGDQSSDLFQGGVSSGVAMLIIDLLEAVEIEIDQAGGGVMALRQRQGL